MNDALIFFLCLILIVAGLVVVVLTAFWWAVWLIAFPMMYVGGLGTIALLDFWKQNRKTKQR